MLETPSVSIGSSTKHQYLRGMYSMFTFCYRGSAEATKQAHNLITALIKDPDVDILTMLPKTTKTTSSATTLWDKTQIGVSIFLIFQVFFICSINIYFYI